ncbi:hypothetical protein V8F06_013676 [Rhypophila decipiens]
MENSTDDQTLPLLEPSLITAEDLDYKIIGELDAWCWFWASQTFLESTKVQSPIPVTAEELKQAALKATAKFKQKRYPKVHRALSNILQQINRHEKAIDVLAQVQQPFMPAVWGFVRVILTTVNDKDTTSHIVVDGIEEFTAHIGRWKDLASLFAKRKDVRDDLVKLYEAFIDFMYSATCYLSGSSFSKYRYSTGHSPPCLFLSPVLQPLDALSGTRPAPTFRVPKRTRDMNCNSLCP